MPKGQRGGLVYGYGINDIVGNEIDGYANSKNKCYQTWGGILERCFSESFHEKYTSYIGTTLCDEWKYYSEFKKWYDDNKKDGYELDKDIIGGNRKHYSPSTCAFVPSIINCCILDGKKRTLNLLPLGITYHKAEKYKNKPYETQLRRYKKLISYGYHSTPEEAHKARQIAKRDYLLELMDKYSSDVIPEVINGLQRRVDILSYDIINGNITISINQV